MSKEKETQMTENAKLYELGFHIVPTVTDEKVTDVFSVISDIISKNGGSIVRSEEPKAIKLAYTIIKKISGKNARFNEAYFAWIKFTADSENIDAIKTELDANEEVLRYIIVKTIDNDERSTAKLVEEEEAEEVNEEETVKEDEESTDEEVEEKSEEVEENKDEIDEAIDELVEEEK